MTDPGPADAVQPGGDPSGAPDGQGQDGITGLFAESLSSAPEEVRPLLEEHLRRIDGDITRRFQSYAERVKPFEALEGIEGLPERLAEVEPETLAELLDFHAIAQDQEQFPQWWVDVGNELGLFDLVDEDGEPGDEDLPGGGADETVEELRERLERLEGTLSEQEASQQRQQRVADARVTFQSRLAELQEQHGELDEDGMSAVLRFAAGYVQDRDEDPIGKAFEDYQRITGRAASGAIEDRLDQPGGGGHPSTQPEPSDDAPMGFKEATAAARRRLEGAGAGV